MDRTDNASGSAHHSGRHAALMDTIYRYQRHVYDLTRKYYLFGRDELIAGLDVPASGYVLEIGCGTGRNLIKAARRYPDGLFYGIDISEEMLQLARKNIARAGLSDRITLQQGDATNFDPQDIFCRNTFDRVFFSYALSMIPPWQASIDHAAGMLSPGGRLLVVDFGDLDRLPPWFRRFLYRWLESFHVSPRLSLRTVLDETGQRHRLTPDLHPLYRGYAWLGTLTAKS
jgi:S-adenosylmethionine-diacylgycerolhomoserine-N-methlytransferase